MSGLPAHLRAETPLLGDRRRQQLFLLMVGLLPLHTVFLSAWVSWKPFLVVLAVLALWDVGEGLRRRAWPWHGRASLVLGVFLGVTLLGFPEAVYRERFLRLFLALVVGGLVLLVSERRLREAGMLDRTLRVVVLSGAAMGVTAVGFSLAAVGALGPRALDTVNDLPLVYRVAKPAYFESGFVALTNWHQDPGYGAAWTSLWAVLVVVAAARRVGTGSRWGDAAVLGGLVFAGFMAFNRTGWLALPLALAVTLVAVVRRRLLTARQAARLAGSALAVAAVLVALIWSVDRPQVGGDLSFQLAFRLDQASDAVASLTGWFAADVDFAEAFSESEERADVWPEYLAMFRAHPLLGVGLGVGWETNSIGQEPHNLVIELLAETGLVGLAAFLGLLGTVLALGGGVAGGAALAAALLPSMTQTVLFEPTWWFAAALYLAGGAPGRRWEPFRPERLEAR